MSSTKETFQNPLATESVGKLILKFAVPAIISNLVSALYNIVDQIFIGQGVGMLGNAATNVAFPITTLCTATALLLGIGSASNFNLSLGAGNKEKAARVVGTGLSSMIIAGVCLAITIITFLNPLLLLFGATENVMPYAQTYTGITTLGIPMIILITGGCQLIRADGSPKYSMVCMLSGAILNTILDPLFIFVFDMGIAGAALATVIGQFVSGILVLLYFKKFKSVEMKKEYFRPKFSYVKIIAALGAASFFNQVAMAIVQIIMNNTLTYYGGLSEYGKDIPLACVGVISKVSIIFVSIIIGIAQGCQPINGFNYGAKNYARVKQTYKTAIIATTVISTMAFLSFQFFPRQIVGIFGSGSEEYFKFAERYFRIYLLMTFCNHIQPMSSNFFTSIGKAYLGIVMSMTRQIIFLIPLIIIFPMFMGIDGVMYAGPIADTAAAVLAIVFVRREFKLITQLEKDRKIELANLAIANQE